MTAWRRIALAGCVLTTGCDGYGTDGPGSDGEARAILYGTVSSEGGVPISTMDVRGSFQFGPCARPDHSRLTTGWRDDAIAVSSGNYRHELRYPYTTSRRETICADLTFTSGDRMLSHESQQLQLTLVQLDQPPDSTRLDVNLRR